MIMMNLREIGGYCGKLWNYVRPVAETGAVAAMGVYAAGCGGDPAVVNDVHSPTMRWVRIMVDVDSNGPRIDNFLYEELGGDNFALYGDLLKAAIVRSNGYDSAEIRKQIGHCIPMSVPDIDGNGLWSISGNNRVRSLPGGKRAVREIVAAYENGDTIVPVETLNVVTGYGARKNMGPHNRSEAPRSHQTHNLAAIRR
jgi:subtilisin family serine protease